MKLIFTLIPNQTKDHVLKNNSNSTRRKYAGSKAGHRVLTLTPKASSNKGKVDEVEFIEIKNFCSVNDC